MKRLTWRTGAGTPNFKMTEAIRKDNIARSAFYQIVCDCLAAYEDIGLTPDEILLRLNAINNIAVGWAEDGPYEDTNAESLRKMHEIETLSRLPKGEK